jgi:CHAT domain-containing protein/Tfp pilus assembly protein PilF
MRVRGGIVVGVLGCGLACSSGPRAKPDKGDAAEAVRLEAEIEKLQKEGKPTEAVALAEKDVELRQKANGADSVEVARACNTLGVLQQMVNQYPAAEKNLRRAIAIQQAARGPEDVEMAAMLVNLASLFRVTGDNAKAETELRHALAIQEKKHADGDIPDTLEELGQVIEAKGDYAGAEPLMRRALAMREKQEPDGLDVAQSLNNLAALLEEKGDFVAAEPMLKRALAIREKKLGPDHRRVASVLNNLAQLYWQKGDYAAAEPLYRRATAIDEKRLPADSPSLATSYDNLAALLQDEVKLDEAEPLYRKALAIREKTLPPKHPQIAISCNNLSTLLRDRGDNAGADALMKRAVEIWSTLGPEHPMVGYGLNGRAVLAKDRGEYEQAEKFFQQALAVREKGLGPEHPDVALTLSNLAALYEARGDREKAVATRARANDIREHNVRLVLATGSEREKLAFMGTVADETEATISLHVTSFPRDEAAARLALETVLRRKGRVLDAMAQTLTALRARMTAENGQLFDRLGAARADLAALVLKGPGDLGAAEHRARSQKLAKEVAGLEEQLGERSATIRLDTAPITVASVQAALPEHAALIEIVKFRPSNARARTPKERWGEPRYAACLLRHTGAPEWVDLAAAEVIDRDVASLRRSLREPSREDVRDRARSLDERVMRPLRKRLGDRGEVFVSPDGPLHLIPFAAMIDERGRFLAERYAFTYLTSGRDLLRFAVSEPSRQPALVMADPAFDAGSVTAAAMRSADLARPKFAALPGTGAEARAVARLLPGAELLTGDRATEAALKQVAGPRVLHLATHGFFLPESEATPNPLLRSGVALAGANRAPTGDDGLVTALEASGLDLHGTHLVVLSACEAGLGELKSGEGVFGLRRALMMAGAETLLMTLWKVDDAATAQLMTEYYRRLASGAGRGEALRTAQAALRSRHATAHPFYWASFVTLGDPRPIPP